MNGKGDKLLSQIGSTAEEVQLSGVPTVPRGWENVYRGVPASSAVGVACLRIPVGSTTAVHST